MREEFARAINAGVMEAEKGDENQDTSEESKGRKQPNVFCQDQAASRMLPTPSQVINMGATSENSSLRGKMYLIKVAMLKLLGPQATKDSAKKPHLRVLQSKGMAQMQLFSRRVY